MAKVKITLVRSIVGRPTTQRKIVEALGLRKLNQTVEHEASPSIMGMADKISHLLKVEEV